MRIGISVAYRPWIEPDEQVALGKLADQFGLDSVWVAESYGQDVTAMLGAIASVTERIRVGSAIMQIPARQPTTTAMAAATLDTLTHGRFMLGLGLSGPQVSEGWYGVPFTNPLSRTREYIEIVRATLSRKPVEFNGKHWTLPLRDGGIGHGKPIRMVGGTVQSHIPIYLGVGGPQTVEQAGRIADGWLPFLYDPADAAGLMNSLMAGLAKSGRRREAIAVTPVVPTAVEEDLDAARDALRPILAMYLGGMGSREKNFYVDVADRYGHGAAARVCQDHFLGGDRRAAEACLTNELIDTFCIAATPATLDTRLGAFADAGVDELVVTPFGNRIALLQALAAAFDRQPAGARS
ncbi:LLM class flavin-dependent oxidoreductase [Rhodococcus sp. WS4]|nr:LLM class flavin-dependent oxidoreductase [Rhodococcus sp. WS4]